MYVISNDDVTAKFLSRYMARKYQQGFGVMDMISPITKELKLIAKIIKDTRLVDTFVNYKNKEKELLNYYGGILKNFLMIMISIFIDEIYKFYKNKYI